MWVLKDFDAIIIGRGAPNPRTVGFIYFDADSGELYVKKGSQWSKFTPSGGGDIPIYKATSDPTPDVNPAEKGAIWINETSGEIWVCTDNTPGANWWKSCCSGGIIKPLDQPLFTLENITAGTFKQLPAQVNAFTLAFYGKDWQSGNYHYFFHSYQTDTESSTWANDAYYGNGFTVRKNCGFDYSYLNSPPAGQELVAIFGWDESGVVIKFYDPNDSYKEVYSATASEGTCPTRNLTIGAYDTKNSYPLGGIIYRVEFYDSKLDPNDFPAIAQRIVSTYKSNSTGG